MTELIIVKVDKTCKDAEFKFTQYTFQFLPRVGDLVTIEGTRLICKEVEHKEQYKQTVITLGR